MRLKIEMTKTTDRHRARLIRGAVIWLGSMGFLWLAPPARAGGFTPEEARARMVIPEGFHVEVFASEPMIRQPVTACFDERGRVWVIEYLQYPNPAGLKPLTVDQYLRTEYDRVLTGLVVEESVKNVTWNVTCQVIEDINLFIISNAPGTIPIGGTDFSRA